MGHEVLRDLTRPAVNVRGSGSGGVNSTGGCDVEPLDLARDVPTTAEDIEVTRRLRRETPSWFSLMPAQLEALIPEGALDRRPVTRPDAQPFTLP